MLLDMRDNRYIISFFLDIMSQQNKTGPICGRGFKPTQMDTHIRNRHAQEFHFSLMTHEPDPVLTECIPDGSDNCLWTASDTAKYQQWLNLKSKLNIILKPCQKAIIDIVTRQDDRKIAFVSDPEGKNGKSALGRFLMSMFIYYFFKYRLYFKNRKLKN